MIKKFLTVLSLVLLVMIGSIAYFVSTQLMTITGTIEKKIDDQLIVVSTSVNNENGVIEFNSIDSEKFNKLEPGQRVTVTFKESGFLNEPKDSYWLRVLEE
ncbi:hypothetical protein LCM20_13425 [Halobacillus litoralis]|uniref:hypothetical protein n=1 Tax=Halobacillus litoralis TaxID=45668 RepID=UPI001CD6C3CF|nr:hypothetical protein [Halobacillus litoralis]MCA0971602.1 hypothetical protein [Halobacillus litoralis]